MTFQEWCDSGDKDGQCRLYSSLANFHKRMHYGDAGNLQNKWIAARIAYDAGIQEGLRLAAERLKHIIYS